MTLDERIERIERAMEFEHKQFEWLSSHDIGSSEDASDDLKEKWRAAILAHDHVIATYQNLLDDLKAR